MCWQVFGDRAAAAAADVQVERSRHNSGDLGGVGHHRLPLPPLLHHHQLQVSRGDPLQKASDNNVFNAPEHLINTRRIS